MSEFPNIVHVMRDESRFEIGIRDVAISHKNFTDVMVREIDSRDAAPLAAADTYWGEQDSLDNIPRKKKPAWVRALELNDE